MGLAEVSLVTRLKKKVFFIHKQGTSITRTQQTQNNIRVHGKKVGKDFFGLPRWSVCLFVSSFGSRTRETADAMAPHVLRCLAAIRRFSSAKKGRPSPAKTPGVGGLVRCQGDPPLLQPQRAWRSRASMASPSRSARELSDAPPLATSFLNGRGLHASPRESKMQ